ncbi:MAG: DNA polymerase III subunit alpha, partial [Bacteroidales bacterium]
IRYGNRYQIDKAQYVNSLFGGDMIEVSSPEIPQVEEWSDLDRLNKERDLIGIYLSAHPLDEYSLILNYVCTTTLKKYTTDFSSLKDKDVIIGGIVTGYRENKTKKGSSFGVITIEDFSGVAEIPLFWNDFVNYSMYGKIGLYLLIRGRVAESKYNNRLGLKISKISLMDKEGEELLDTLTIGVESKNCNSNMVAALKSAVSKHKGGNGRLYFEINDSKTGYSVTLISRMERINIDRRLIAKIEEISDVYYKINGKSPVKEIEEEKPEYITEEVELID